jgi:hypothetical protein
MATTQGNDDNAGVERVRQRVGSGVTKGRARKNVGCRAGTTGRHGVEGDGAGRRRRAGGRWAKRLEMALDGDDGRV